MPVHDQVLQAARRLCRERGGWTFSPDEVVRALPHLNPGSIRTHIVSRCCVNAPRHHSHRWPYFRRVARGSYEILSPHRRETRAAAAARRGAKARGDAAAARERGMPAPLRETAAPYGARHAGRPRDTVHAVVTQDGAWYVAECLEIAVVTQGRTLDELVGNVGDAVALHLEGGEAAALGIAAAPRIAFTYETAPRRR